MKGTQAMNRSVLLKYVCVSICVISLIIPNFAAGMAGNKQNPAGQKDNLVKTSGKLSLWYEQPAKSWMTEALPIGNGPMGAMLFGGTELERIQFNEISLWGGDRMLREDKKKEDMGYYQAFGDIFIRLGHDMAKVKNYRRQLDIERAIHSVAYEYEGLRYQQTAFASHPAHVIVVHLTADKPGAYTGRVWLTDMHDAQIKMKKNRFSSVGKFDIGF